MHRTTIMIAAAVTLAMLPGCGSSNPPKGQTGSTGTRTPEEIAGSAPYRIGGAALMMTPTEVASALTGAGYALGDRIGERDMTLSFEDQVQQRVTGKPVGHPTQVPSSQVWSKGQESVRVTYGLYRGGPKVVHYTWSTDAPSPTDAEIVSTLEKRYGPGWRPKPSFSERGAAPSRADGPPPP